MEQFIVSDVDKADLATPDAAISSSTKQNTEDIAEGKQSDSPSEVVGRSSTSEEQFIQQNCIAGFDPQISLKIRTEESFFVQKTQCCNVTIAPQQRLHPSHGRHQECPVSFIIFQCQTRFRVRKVL